MRYNPKRLRDMRIAVNESPSKKTWLAEEACAYMPRGSQARPGVAICEDGITRAVRAGIPDTYFSIPAHCRIRGKYAAGYVTVNANGEYEFHTMKGEEKNGC